MTGTILAGCGGWTFEPWRGVFYPDTVKQKDELAYMSRQIPTIEINGTYYSAFKPDTWKKWRDETPDDFVFSVKASRFATNRRVLAEAGESVAKFLGQGLTELGPKLGPILWQFANTKKFDEADFEGFLNLLPKRIGDHAARHVVEVRHDSFVTPAFAALLRKHGVAVCWAVHEKYPEIADVTADFIYARLQTGSDDVPTAYPPKQLKAFAEQFETFANGGEPDGPQKADPGHKAAKADRDAFVYFIHEGKVRAPHAAQAFMQAVGKQG
ncbi:MAG: DUF72 domain-containing protein [Caulobacterales bacterium]|nr:DUF72 domain-containing protein [Caulobacterales bacterium]